MRASLINPRLDDFFRDLAERAILVGPVQPNETPPPHWRAIVTGRIKITGRLAKFTLADDDRQYVAIARTTVILTALAHGIRVCEWSNRQEYVEQYRAIWPNGVPEKQRHA